jgi:hypothetical protein
MTASPINVCFASENRRRLNALGVSGLTRFLSASILVAAASSSDSCLILGALFPFQELSVKFVNVLIR